MEERVCKELVQERREPQEEQKGKFFRRYFFLRQRVQ